MNAARRTIAGMALMSAIFLIGVLAALGLAMATISTGSHDTATKSLQAARVYYGAKAGLEWGIQQAVAANACAASTPFTLGQGGLNGIHVTVTCEASTHGGSDRVYRLTSCAVTNGTCAAPPGTLGPDYAERRVEATVSNIP